MHYKISKNNSEPYYIDVEMTILNIDSDKIKLQLPAWRPGRYQLANFAKRIKGFLIKDVKGNELSFKKITKDLWEVQTSGCTEIKVSYSYYAYQIDGGSSYVDDEQLYVNPINCLMYVPNRMYYQCEVEMDISKKYKVAIGLPQKGKKFIATDYHQLVDSPFIASEKLFHDFYEVEKTKFNIHIQGEIHFDIEKLKFDFKKFTQEQFNLFGSFPFEEYHFLFQFQNEKAYHGVEHQNNTVITLGPAKDIGGVLYKELLGVSSHELFHAWNVKAIRPIEMQPYDYTQENYTNLGYVIEGVTTYYGDVILHRCGLLSDEEFDLIIDKAKKRYFDNEGRKNYSVAQSSFDTWIDGYEKGAPGRKVSIYNEGMLCALMLDKIIKQKTDGQKSLDNVMRLMYNRFGKTEKGYSEQDYKNACEEVYGGSLDEYFENYIWGTKPYFIK